MSIPVRQSTAFECSIGPVLDADGVAFTGAVVGDFKIKKTTGNFAALNGSATLTHVSVGVYDLVLTTSDTDTVGLATIAIDDTVNACASVHLQVMEEAVYDRDYAASATGKVTLADVAHGGAAATLTLDTLTVNDTAALPSVTASSISVSGATTLTGAFTATNASNDVRGVVPTTASKTGYALSSTGMDAVTLPANLITATSIANDAITAAKIANGAIDAATFAADVDAEILSYIVDDATRIDASALNTASGTTIPAILEDTGTTLDGRIPAALVGGRMDSTVDGTGMETGAIDAIWTRALTEAYAADGATFTGAQALYMLFAMLAEASVSGTTLTAKKLDGSTTAMTFTINDASTPTSITRSG